MNIKPKKILTEISAGELFDKISILEIKLKNVQDNESKIEINKEYEILRKVQNSNIKITESLENLITKLKNVNLNLWNIENKIRACEKNKDFKENFIQLAREIYLNNDKRAKFKSEINGILNSNVREIKQYENY